MTLWLWFTVLFANFAEAIAEGRSKAQADALRSAKRDVIAKKLARPDRTLPPTIVKSTSLGKGDIFIVDAGDFVPADGEVIEGVASVDESAITGESAPVIREAGGDFSSVTGGTRVLSDWLVVRVTVDPGEAFLDRMIAMVGGGAPAEDAERDRAFDPAREAHDRVPADDGDAAAVLALRGGSGEDRHSGHDHRAGRPARLPDPDDDRRFALRDRSRRHRPDAAAERDRDVGPRGRGGRRRRRAAARQDRHDHARQPAGIRTDRCDRRERARARRRRAALVAARRAHRRAAASSFSRRRSTACASATSTRSARRSSRSRRTRG